MEAGDRIRILFVEDVPSDAELAERELRKEGISFASTRVETKDEFVTALDEFRPDLVISDYTLPAFNGLQALKLSLERDAALPFILFTGSMNEETAVACIKAGATDYVLKEGIARLPFALKEALEQKQTRLAKEAAERALRESEARFRLAMDATNDGLWEWDITTGHTYYSPAYFRMLGYEPEEFANTHRTWTDLIHPDDREHALAVNQDCVENRREAFHVEFRMRAKNGEWQWILGRGKAVKRDAGGRALLMVGTHVDITERKRAEDALRESEARFSTVFHASPVGISITHLVDGQFIDANSAFLSLFGYTREEVIGHTWRELQGWVHPVERDRLVEVLGEHGRFHDVEVKFRGKSGEIADVLLSAEVIELAGGQYVLNLIHDITERKQRQRELEAIAAMAMALRAAPTRAEMLPVIVHQVFNLLKADGAALAIPEPATGGAVIAFAHGEWVDRTGAHFPAEAGVTGHVLTTGRAYLNNDATNDPHNVRPDLVGDLRALACVPLIAQDQAIGALWVGRKTVIAEEELRLLIAISDIAANALLRAQIVETLEQRVAERTRELAQANERLEELDRLKSKFVSDVSHELRTPVAVLKLHAELLEHGRPEKREQYVKVIGEQADRQAQLVEDILNLSRLELGADKVQFAPVALNTLVSQIVEAHQPAVEAAGLTLTFMPDPDLPSVRGEYNQLAQVITNLIANAINYMPAGRVQVSTGLKDRQVVVEVRDTGMGIASEDLPHLFERFYRGQRTQHIRGTGLGLAIVKEIVDLHGGSIEVESAVGVGSTFRVCLPIMERGA